jgi:hypothetical protein
MRLITSCRKGRMSQLVVGVNVPIGLHAPHYLLREKEAHVINGGAGSLPVGLQAPHYLLMQKKGAHVITGGAGD